MQTEKKKRPDSQSDRFRSPKVEALVTPIVNTHPDATASVVDVDTLNVGQILGARFPTPEDVQTAVDGFRRDEAGASWAIFSGEGLGTFAGTGTREHVQCRVEVGPGYVGVYSTALHKQERAKQREADRRRSNVALAGADLDREALGVAAEAVFAAGLALREAEADDEDVAESEKGKRGRVRSFSRKSRANMVRTYAGLDMRPLVQGVLTVDVTLTLPGDWLAVAPDHETAHRAFKALSKRFARKYGARWVCIWKREFQRRGAPHWHMMLALPAGETLEGFRDWLAGAWAGCVGASGCKAPAKCGGCCERGRHLLAGVTVSRTRQEQLRDPKRAGIYFSKHGLLSAKDYQNEAPEAWMRDGKGVGRFWGHCGLEVAVVKRHVSWEDALWVARVVRRHQHSQRYYVQVPVWRKVTTVDKETGELGWKWRKRKTTVSPKRMPGSRGYAVLNDGPKIAADIARFLDVSDQAAGHGDVVRRSGFGRWERGLDGAVRPHVAVRTRAGVVCTCRG